MTKVRIIQLLLIVFSICPITARLVAEELSRPRVMVKPTAMIKGERILLGEVAQISYEHEEFKDLAEQLAAIDLGASPYPLSSQTIVGETVLAAITAKGIKLETLGYSVPKTITVQRQGREVNKDEVLQATRQLFSQQDVSDVQVQDVQWKNNQIIPLGASEIKVSRLGELANGKIPLRVEVIVDGAAAARFLATALADDWREVPVPRRSIERGSLIQAEDMQLVRLNINREPEDTIVNIANVVGYRAKGNLLAGEAIRAANVDIPPLVPRGATVTMVYNRGGLLATALGQAVNDGFAGGEINVKNTKSQKVVKAKIVNADRVEVIVK